MSPFGFLFKRKSLQKKQEREREARMIKNGARLLQELISSCDGRGCNPIRMFSAEEIEEATKELHSRGGFTIHFRGTYEDRPVFIKKYRRQPEYAFNEIVIISQINHRNVVKLLGCCLETELPILVYEQLPNKLSRRLHHKANNPSGPISWEHRLRIAIETAYAITFLHIAHSRPIVHRNITSFNILLDEHYRPKLCGFGLSITIPLGETHVRTVVTGIWGYADPDYLATGTISEKTDVYSFGILLLELLSGKGGDELMMIAEAEELMWWDFASLDKEKRLGLISENGLSMDAREVAQSMACIELASRCMALKPEERPPMKEVVQQLQQIERHELPSFSSSSSFISQVN